MAVRINSLQSGLAEDDLSVILSEPVWPTTLLIPKVESADEVDHLVSLVSSQIKTRPSGEDLEEASPLRLILYIESAKALLGMKKIVKSAVKLGDKSGGAFQLDGLVFGSDDYCAGIGANRSSQASEVIFARQYFVTVIKSFQRQLQAIDLVHIDYKGQWFILILIRFSVFRF